MSARTVEPEESEDVCRMRSVCQSAAPWACQFTRVT